MYYFIRFLEKCFKKKFFIRLVLKICPEIENILSHAVPEALTLIYDKVTVCLYIIILYNAIDVMHVLMLYRKTCIFASLFPNIFIQVIFRNIITCLDTIFKKEQNAQKC